MNIALSTWCSPGRIEDKWAHCDRFDGDEEKRIKWKEWRVDNYHCDSELSYL